MNPSYQINSVHGPGTSEVTEVAAALVQETPEVLSHLGPKTILSIEAELKCLGQGEVASNLRVKDDADLNNKVVANYMELFRNYASYYPNPREIGDVDTDTSPRQFETLAQRRASLLAAAKAKGVLRPIIITTVSRSKRYITYSITESGTMKASHTKLDAESPEGVCSKSLEDTNSLNEFVASMSIDREKLLKMRESTKGAGYRTYLADSLAFIYLVNSKFHPEMFDKKKRTPFVVNSESQDFWGKVVLTEIEVNGRKWAPKNGFDYLYFTEENGSVTGLTRKMDELLFWEPVSGSIVEVYRQLGELLSTEENITKQIVRKYFDDIATYHRFSDYWVNDIDDAFTIYMVFNAYKFATLSKEEEMVKEQLSSIIERFS